MPPRDPDHKPDLFNPSGVTHAARLPVTSLYIHVPFCGSKCSYCDFYSIPDPGEDLQVFWHDHLILELERLAGEADRQGVLLAPLRTVYFGGGTPSLLPVQLLLSIVERIGELFSFSSSCDITLEANPESYSSREKAHTLKLLVAAGVNRVSFGVQTSSDPLLASIGRRHTVKDAEFAIGAASDAGFDHLAVDLMTGLPDQRLADVRETLDLMLRLPVDHVSSYALTLAEETAMAFLYKESPSRFPDDGLERRMTHEVTARLKSVGFEHYEISNYARPGARSLHNLVYWQADPYLAAGPAAASYLGGIRRVNPPSLLNWADLVEDPDGGPYGTATMEEVVDEKAARVETMVLGLRLIEGVTRQNFRLRHGIDYEEIFGERLFSLEKRKLIIQDQESVRLSERGLDFADLVARELL
jgi:oxygen-independent coproporphyrinogen-3 oxidase